MTNESLILRIAEALDAMLGGETKSHEDLVQYIKDNLLPSKIYSFLTADDIEKVAFKYETIYGGRTFRPLPTITKSKPNESWLVTAKNSMSKEEHCFEERYRHYLETQHFANVSIDEILKDAEKVLSLCSDPKSGERKRGLVMGDVQSGKTSNYLALASMACDYGYKCILILAGLTDSLRIQTQERTDEAIIGAVSSTIGSKIEYIGVGQLGDNGFQYYAVPLTTNLADFTAISATSTDFEKPLILVAKKNKTVLDSIHQWLKPGVRGVSSQNILIIDDECDNASVNTKTDASPSTINSLIRDIYNNFNCSSYVGYTATPFANVFINPEKQEGFDDLFPEDFIHRLRASSASYFGADKVFTENSAHLVLLDEQERDFLPAKHKKSTQFDNLPESLRDAVCNFLLCNCIRTARGDKTKHRSMMINISPFNSLQGAVKDLVEIYIGSLTDKISNYSKKDMSKFLKDSEMRRLYSIYQKEPFFAEAKCGRTQALNVELPFEKLKTDYLFDEISKIVVAVINNKYKGDQRFDYKRYKDTGARVIAIGGFVLSRGLTLEGLMTSYFSRNSGAYDTLLQMCRWFGYRPNYEDLCRIYMSQINVDSFGAVIQAVSDLDNQLEVMQAEGKTPSDFGLMIKTSPDTLETNLLITARNKMKNSKEVVNSLNYSGVAIDTSKLSDDPKNNAHNIAVLRELYDTLEQEGKNLEMYGSGESKRPMYRDVEPSLLAKLISKLCIPLENKKFDKEAIANFIAKAELFKKWDIVFASGDNGNSELPDFTLPNGGTMKPSLRKFEKRDEEMIIRISGSNNRVLQPNIFNAGLDAQGLKQADENRKIRLELNPDAKSDSIIAADFLNVPGRKPLFVIMPIYLNDNGEERKKAIRNKFGSDFLFAFGIGFAGKRQGVMVSYRMNKVKQEQYKNMDDANLEEIDDD